MCDTPNRPVRDAILPPTCHWETAAFDSSMGHVKYIKHWKPCLGALMCYFGTNNRLLIYTLCVMLPTGQWGIPHYSQPTTEEWLHLTAIWGTRNTSNIENHVCEPWCVIWGQIIVSWYMHYVWYSQPASEEKNTFLPTGHWGMAAFDSKIGHVKHIKHWKPCLGALMCYFGTNNRLLIYALCVMLPTGQWGTPNYSQLATEDGLHLTAMCGTWNTSNIENNILGPSCNISRQIIVSWYMHYVWYSQPASEKRHITPNQPLRNGCIWQQQRARETH